MRVVVIGATGNIGTSTVQALAADPRVHSIVGVARRRPDWQVAKTEWVTADVAEGGLTPLFSGADVVVHLAWLFQPTHDPLTTWRTNALGSGHVFRAVAEARVPALVYSSSVGAYSPGPKHDAVNESWPTDGWPDASYSREKAYVERLLDIFEYEHPECRTVRIRPGFVFKRESAMQQRRLFAGPFIPHRLIRRSTIPIVPDIAGLRFQALHSADAGQAFRLAALGDFRGAVNIAAEPVVDVPMLCDLLNARPVKLPVAAARTAMAAAWNLHLLPASPHLFDLALHVPIMDWSRARTELGWSPAHTSAEALREFFDGLSQGTGGATPPLAAKAGGTARSRELASGVGRRP